jgi:hypothetical protein
MNKLAENVAFELLARDGVAAIWKIHVAAAQAWRIGHIAGAEVLLDIADAAETIRRGELRSSKRAGGTVPSPSGVEPEAHPIRALQMMDDMHDTKTRWSRHIGHTA